jgi:hypothetical protein
LKSTELVRENSVLLELPGKGLTSAVEPLVSTETTLLIEEPPTTGNTEPSLEVDDVLVTVVTVRSTVDASPSVGKVISIDDDIGKIEILGSVIIPLLTELLSFANSAAEVPGKAPKEESTKVLSPKGINELSTVDV